MADEAYDRTVTARRRHRCEDYTHRLGWIEAGERYVRTVMFPGGVNSSDRPWAMRICGPCWLTNRKALP